IPGPTWPKCRRCPRANSTAPWRATAASSRLTKSASAIPQPSGSPKWPRVVEQSEARFVAGPVFFDMAGEREADVARKNQCAGRRAIVQHAAAADARLLNVGILWEIPVRIIDLQQVMKDVADERRAVAADIQAEDKMPG